MNHAAQEYHRAAPDRFEEFVMRPFKVVCPTCQQPVNRICISPLGVPLPAAHEARQDLARELVA